MKHAILLAMAAAWAMTPSMAAAQAQSSEIVAPPSPDADALAAAMRVLAETPEDFDTLVRAGALATRVGDLAAAEALFTRADRIAPGDGRLLAGKAALAVEREHPGQALALFARAEATGVSLAPYLADRALAYDLTGDQRRAQRDYREALKSDTRDLTSLRLALSLGISGKRAEALALIDPMVRKSDRGAWRVRSFVLAMTGDVTGAQAIADAMLPPGMALGLRQFFTLLPTLGPVDRAFAVHFGELRPTPDRIADARLAPVLAPLPPEPVIVATPVPLATKASLAQTRRKRRGAKPDIPPAVTVAQVQAPPPAPALPPPPREAIEENPPVEVAAAQPVQSLPTRSIPAENVRIPASADRGAAPAATPAPPAVKPAPVEARPVEPKPVEAKPADPRPAPLIVTVPPAPTPSPVPQKPTDEPPAAVEPAPPPVAPRPSEKPAPGEPERPSERISPATPVVTPPAPRPARAKPKGTGDDPVIANILAGLDADAPKPAPAKVAERATDKAAKPDDCKPTAARGAKGKPAAKGRAKTAPCPAEPDAKATKKGKDDPAKKEPARVWVQVAGGANEGSLAKAWAALKAKAPAAFKGKAGWTTPLRATNRVLTGPFKTRAEAQAFVNLVAKSGISAFVFESEAGQKIDKLGAQ